jgi:coproporphyrinogen dehydrogenase HemZ
MRLKDMLYVSLNNKDYFYEIQELIKLFVKPSDFLLVSGHKENGSSEEEFREDIVYLYIHIDLEVKPEINVVLKSKNKDEKSCATLGLLGKGSFNKKQVKDTLKRSLLSVLSKHYQYNPPWGILTGVRPSKIVNEMFDQGASEASIIQQLRSYYVIQDEKIELLLNVAQKERGILQDSLENSVSLYIGIPFCPSRCIYCSFTSYIGDEAKMDGYLKALIKEIQYAGQEVQRTSKTVESIYIGGGTPTSLYAHQLDALLFHIQNSFDTRLLKEYTVECGRPDTITKEKLMILKKYNVDRISINPQTMKNETLQMIGRKHDAEDIKEAFRCAKEIGFKSINADLIAGLPGEKPEDFKKSLEEVIQLDPENITLHTLAIKKASELRHSLEKHEGDNEENVKEMLRIGAELLKDKGYEPYYMYRQKYISANLENVGYAKPSFQSFYNIMMIEEKQSILALGAGAVSKIFYKNENRFERIANVSNYEIYQERIDDMIEKKKSIFFNY